MKLRWFCNDKDDPSLLTRLLKTPAVLPFPSGRRITVDLK